MQTERLVDKRVFDVRLMDTGDDLEDELPDPSRERSFAVGGLIEAERQSAMNVSTVGEGSFSKNTEAAANRAAHDTVFRRRISASESQARILFVDDQPQLRRLGELVLVLSGYEVDTAADGVEAWAALHDVNYNLLVTDHEMPRMKGLELAARVRLAGMKLPILLVSDSSDDLRDPSGTWLDLTARLVKPFGVEAFLDTVGRALRVANSLPDNGSTMISFSACCARVEPYLHGGINE